MNNTFVPDELLANASSDDKLAFGMRLAIVNGDARALAYLASRARDVDHRDQQSGAPPLALAVLLGNVELVDLLLDAGASLDSTTRDGDTPLATALICGQVAIAEKFVSRGADLAAAYERRCVMPARHGHVAMLGWLCDRGFNLAQHPALPHLLGYIAGDGQAQSVRWLLRQGVHPDVVGAADASPAIFMAISQGDVETVQAFVEGGASMTSRTSHGATPLVFAAANAQRAMLPILLPGSDIEAVDANGYSALYIAAANGYCEVVQFLLEHGARIHPTWKMDAFPCEISSQLGVVLEGHEPLVRAPASFVVPDRPSLIVSPGNAAEISNDAWIARVAALAAEDAQSGRPPTVARSRAAGASGVAMSQKLHVHLPLAEGVEFDDIFFAKILYELFVGLTIFENDPEVYLEGLGGFGAARVRPAYVGTLVGETLSDAAALVRACCSGMWLPRSRYRELPPHSPVRESGRRAAFEALGALDMWRDAPGGGELARRCAAWNEAYRTDGVREALLALNTQTFVRAQHDNHVLVGAVTMLRGGGARATQQMSEVLGEAHLALAPALEDVMQALPTGREIMHRMQLVSFLTALLEDMRARELMPDLSRFECLPLSFTTDSRVPFTVPARGEADATPLATTPVLTRVSQADRARRPATAVEMRAFASAGEAGFCIDGRAYASFTLDVARLDVMRRQPDYFFEARDKARAAREALRAQRSH